MILDELPAELSPIVQPIDDWNTCRKLGLVFEAQVEQGKLVVAAIDLVKDLEQRPVARQLRHSLLEYMSSEQFAPATVRVARCAASACSDHRPGCSNRRRRLEPAASSRATRPNERSTGTPTRSGTRPADRAVRRIRMIWCWTCRVSTRSAD